MPAWRWQMYAVVAGDDKLADAKATMAMLATVNPKTQTPIVPAVHRNNAGIIGAAALALD